MSNIAFVLNLCCIIICVTIVYSSKRIFLDIHRHTFTECCAITKPNFENCEIKATDMQSDHLSRVIKNPTFCICENKDAVTAKLISAFVFAS